MPGLFDLSQQARSHPPPPSEKDYYATIGEFIVSYAQAECLVNQLGRKLSGLKEDKARILFAGMRFGDMKSRILAMLRISKRTQKTKKEIEVCLQHLDVIGLERDKMCHRSFAYEAWSVRITNQLTAKSMLEYEQDLFSLGDLLAMQLDCLKITIRISHVINPALRREANKRFLHQIHGPWTYTPARQRTHKKGNRSPKTIAKLLLQQPPYLP